MRLQEHAIKEIKQIIAQFIDEPTPLMMILSAVQTKFGYIPQEAQELISEETGISVAEIYGVVTFYSFFSLEPKGKYIIGVCLGTACYVKNSQQVIDKFCQVLGIQPGQTTKDGMYTIDALRCIGACALAPAVRVNDKVYPQVRVDDVEKILKDCEKMEAEK